MSLIFGKLTQDFINFQLVRAQADQGNQDGINSLPGAAAHFRTATALDASYLVYIGILLLLINLPRSLNPFPGVAMFFANLVYMSIWSHTSEVGARRLRETYLASILRQDIAFFDNVGAGEIATRIETDTRQYLPSFSPYFLLILYFRSLPARHFRKDPVGNQFLGRFLYRFHPRLYPPMETRSRHVLHYSHDFHHFRSNEQVHLQIHAGISQAYRPGWFSRRGGHLYHQNQSCFWLSEYPPLAL